MSRRPSGRGAAPTLSRRRALLLAGAGAVAGLLGACQDPTAAPPGKTGSAQTAPLRTTSFEITITSWPSLLYGTPYMVAMARGYFRDEGIQISNVVGSSGGETTVRNVITGGLPFGEVATTAAVRAFDAGAPLVVVGGGVRTVAEIYWVVLDGSPLQTIQDLKGRTLGFTSAGSVTEAVATLSLERADGVDRRDVACRPTGGVSEGLKALKDGSVDATVHLEPLYRVDRQAGEPLRILFRATAYIQCFQQTVQIVGPGLMQDHPGLIQGILRARQRGIQLIVDNPEEAAHTYAAVAGLPPDLCLQAFGVVDPASYYGVGLDPQGLALVEESLQTAGLYRQGQKVAWGEMVRQDFLPRGAAPLRLS